MTKKNVRANNDSPQRNRRSIRLKGYDYSWPGAYFVSICAHNRECLFGEIVNGGMVLNDAGRMAEQCWHNIPLHFPHVELDAFVVMPNHVHGILFVVDAPVGAKIFSPLQSALRNINPNIPPDAIDGAFRKITRTESPSLIENNRRFHRMITYGVAVEFPIGRAHA